MKDLSTGLAAYLNQAAQFQRTTNIFGPMLGSLTGTIFDPDVQARYGSLGSLGSLSGTIFDPTFQERLTGIAALGSLSGSVLGDPAMAERITGLYRHAELFSGMTALMEVAKSHEQALQLGKAYSDIAARVNATVPMHDSLVTLIRQLEELDLDLEDADEDSDDDDALASDVEHDKATWTAFLDYLKAAALEKGGTPAKLIHELVTRSSELSSAKYRAIALQLVAQLVIALFLRACQFTTDTVLGDDSSDLRECQEQLVKLVKAVDPERLVSTDFRLVALDRLAVRTRPRKKAEVVARLPLGTVVHFIAKRRKHALIGYYQDNACQIGWVKSKHLETM